MAGEGYALEPMDADSASLAGLLPELVFAMGAEWEMFRRKLNGGAPFRTQCFPPNVARLVKLAERHGRFVEWHPGECGRPILIVGSASEGRKCAD